MQAGTAHPVSDVELASRLSFFLWSSIPDQTLMDLAVAGKLRQPGVLAAQVRRMIADDENEDTLALREEKRAAKRKLSDSRDEERA